MIDWVDRVFCEDALAGMARLPDGAIDLILTDPPYNLGKDYGNSSDQQSVEDYLAWTEQWIDIAIPKLKPIWRIVTQMADAVAARSLGTADTAAAVI